MCTIENGVHVVSAYTYGHSTVILAPNGKVLDEAAVMVARLQKWVRMNRSGDVTIPYGISGIDRDASDGKHTGLDSFAKI